MLSDLQKRLRAAQLYAIIDTAYLANKEVTFFAKEFVKGGADIIQLRAKHESLDQVETMAKAIHQITQKAQIPFILNDYVELAAKLEVEGIHVGQEDMPLKEVKRLMPSQTLIGKSTHSLEQALATQEEQPDYIGFGPLFATQTKPTYTPIGLNFISEVHQRVNLPIFCIGGIKGENVDAVLQAGAKRVVVVSGIMQALSPREECLKFKQYLSN